MSGIQRPKGADRTFGLRLGASGDPEECKQRRACNRLPVILDEPSVIGLAFMLTRMMIYLVIGIAVASVALAFWMLLAMLMLLPGDKRGRRRSMRSASRLASRSLRRIV